MNTSELESNLQRVLDFIEKADSKANIQLPTSGIILTAIATTGIGNEKLGTIIIFLLIISVLFLVATMILDLFVVYPRLMPSKYAASKIYFYSAHLLETLSPGCVKKFLESTSVDDYNNELIGQIIENNRVAARKYRHLNISSKILMIGIVFSAIYLTARIVGIS